MAIAETTSRKSMVDAAYEKLKYQIINNILPPGFQALEIELASQLGMSRTPVREALIKLQNEGLVEVIPRKGIRVRPLTIKDIREITEVLACLECEAAEKLASRRLSSDELESLDQAISDMDAALETEDMQAWSEADYRFHKSILEMCGNQYLTDVAMNFLEKAHRFRTLTLPHRDKPIYSNVNHAAVVEAIRRGDPQSATEIHRSHKRRWSRELNDIIDRLNLTEK